MSSLLVSLTFPCLFLILPCCLSPLPSLHSPDLHFIINIAIPLFPIFVGNRNLSHRFLAFPLLSSSYSSFISSLNPLPLFYSFLRTCPDKFSFSSLCLRCIDLRVVLFSTLVLTKSLPIFPRHLIIFIQLFYFLFINGLFYLFTYSLIKFI